MRIIFLGAPGVGKGTQAKLLSSTLGLPHISTGDLFRANINNQTILGNQVKSLIDNGALVPDDLTLSMVKERIQAEDCSKGFILDGFPRNLNQAKELDAMLSSLRQGINKAILLDLPKQTILDRIAGRRFCPDCGTSYHETMKPSILGNSCERCGAALEQRQDDREEIVLERISIFERTARPMIDYYHARGILYKVCADQDIDRIFVEICDDLKAI